MISIDAAFIAEDLAYQKVSRLAVPTTVLPFPDCDIAASYGDSGRMLVRLLPVCSEVRALKDKLSIRNHTACSGMTRWRMTQVGHWPISDGTGCSQSKMMPHEGRVAKSALKGVSIIRLVAP